MRFRIKKQLAFLFTVIIIAVQFPYAALAETDVRDIQTVASFSALGDDVKKQTVPIGTEQEELILPDQLEVEIIASQEERTDTATPSEAEKDMVLDEETVYPAWIPVTWDSEPEYDGDTEGRYVFTADTGGYVLADSAKLPGITVTVEKNSEILPPDDSSARLVSSLMDGGGMKVFKSYAAFKQAFRDESIQGGDVILVSFIPDDSERVYFYYRPGLMEVSIIWDVGEELESTFENVGRFTLKQGDIHLEGKVGTLIIEDGIASIGASEINDITMLGGYLYTGSSNRITGGFIYQGGTIDGALGLSGDGVFINDSDKVVEVTLGSTLYALLPGSELKADGTVRYPIVLETVEGGTAAVSHTMAAADEVLSFEAIPKKGYVFKRWLVVDAYGMSQIFSESTTPSASMPMISSGITVTPIFYSTDASLSSLQYQVEGKAPAAVPGFTGYQDTYHVFLPPDTPQSAVIALKGVPAHQEAKVVGNPQITLSRGAGAASLTVAAQEDTVQKNYTVNFTVTGKNGTSGSSGDSSGGGSSTVDLSVLYGNWEQIVTGGWMFKMTNGSYAKSRWGQVKGLWYYFDAEGRMLTGWYYDQNYKKWFYLEPNGDMAVGWRQIDGKWYYFNPVSDGTKGAMAADTEVDGYTIGADGAAMICPAIV